MIRIDLSWTIIFIQHMMSSTPLSRLWLGITQYVFRKLGLLDECIDTAIGYEVRDRQSSLRALGMTTIRHSEFGLYN